MMESMIKKPHPTRAEGSDMANEVLDGADCIKLSGETAKGDHPLEAVGIQHLIAHEAESAIYYLQLFEELRRWHLMPATPQKLLPWVLWRPLSSAAMGPLSCSPSLAGVLTRWPVQDAWAEDVDLRVNLAMNVGKARDFFNKEIVVIVLTGWSPGSDFTNTMRVVPQS
ncbi:hypothetical protein U0070_021917 [Myodes glareolus]|uniref:Pyruvate kinase n=1 Tax=Myodes glareolus TaxID=447135 RepID=A0AAW0IFM3_MYOGA